MGRPNPDYFNLETGNIGGLRLYPGLYKVTIRSRRPFAGFLNAFFKQWTTDVYINNLVRLSGGPNDTYIFQISGAREFLIPS